LKFGTKKNLILISLPVALWQQRWLKFVKYFTDFGIQLIVLYSENPTYPIIDKNLLKKFQSD
jgi:hypothetical protein